jgi:hypothetical protein
MRSMAPSAYPQQAIAYIHQAVDVRGANNGHAAFFHFSE